MMQLILILSLLIIASEVSGQIIETSSDRVEQRQKQQQEIEQIVTKYENRLKLKNAEISKISKKVRQLQDSLSYIEQVIAFDSVSKNRIADLTDSLRQLHRKIMQDDLLVRQKKDSLEKTIYILTKSYELCKGNDSIVVVDKVKRNIDKEKSQWNNQLKKIQEEVLQLEIKRNDIELVIHKLELKEQMMQSDIVVLEKQNSRVRNALRSLQNDYEKKLNEMDELRKESIEIDESIFERKKELLELEKNILNLEYERNKLRYPMFNILTQFNVNKYFDNFFRTNNSLYFGGSLIIGYYLDKDYRTNSNNSFVLINSISYVDSSLINDIPRSSKNIVLVNSEVGFFFNQWFLLGGGIVQNIGKQANSWELYPTVSVGFYIPFSSNIMLPIRASAIIVSNINEPVIGLQTGLSFSFDLIYK